MKYSTYDDIRRFLKQMAYVSKSDSKFNFDTATNRIIDLVEDYFNGIAERRAKDEQDV